ncbi:Nitrogen permease regulator 3 [Xanthoria calcicola]
MASDVLPPNPCLLAILLVVKINSEPRIIFHYPPRPGQDNSHFARYLAAQDHDKDGSSSTDDDSTSSQDEEVVAQIKTKESKTGDNTPELDFEETGSISPEKNDIWKDQYGKPKWNDVFGLRAYGLARLLCPPPTSHKQRFEMSIDDKVFVGRPIFAREGEEWKKKKEERKRRERKSGTESEMTGVQEKATGSDRLHSSAQESANSTAVSDFGETSGDGLEIRQEAFPASKVDRPLMNNNEKFTGEKSKAPQKTLNMFHVVFVLNPPPLEYHLRVKEMYDHVIKKFSKILKREQAHSAYVLREISAMFKDTPKMKGAHSEDQTLATLYHKYLSQSTLARAISVIYNNISISRIAHVNLTHQSSPSFQIPIPTSISVLPGPLSPQMPGMWLTTATSFPTDDDMNMTSSQLASHFTLLLLTDLSTILSDINDTTSPLSAPLTHYLRVSKPTKSFVQISQSSGIPMSDIQFMASHLVYWRKARAIPPLCQRDAYIVSPNADMTKLVSASSKFAKAYPALPSLPKILNLLSTPRAYSTLIPSKDHKEAFMDILAWLLRGGWVTQLRTFVWVRVPSHIKETVESQGEPDRSLESSTELPPKRNDNEEGKESRGTLAVPQPPSPTSSTTSTHTTIPFRSSQDPSNPPPAPSLIQNPRQASGVSSRWLAAISIHILKAQGVESQKAWNRCLRYFDGKHAVEMIAVREGWKRKKVAELVAGWEAEGLLLRGKHW